MFWKYNLITTSHLETLLDKEDVTLRQIMDQEDVLQECKSQSKKLIDFLVRPESMDDMVTLITQEPSDEFDEKLRYKYSNISCEILTFDVAAINEYLASNEILLNKLYSFLETDKPLNPLLASFFSKTMAKVFSWKTSEIFDYLKSKPDFITLLLNHLDTSAIMDLLVRLLTYSENIEMREKVLSWLNEQTIVQRLVGLIDPAFSEDCHCNAAQALCDMIKSSREQMSLLQESAKGDPLLDAIESTEVVSDLITHMFNGEKKESVFVNGIAVLLALLEFKKHGPASSQQVPPNQNQSSLQGDNAPQMFASLFFRSDGPEQMTSLDAERLATGVNNMLEAVIPQISDFHKLFYMPPTKPPMTLTIGCLDPPLGYTRIELSRFMVALIATNTHGVNCQLATLGTVHIMMELFFKYSWNNFLHTQVEHAISRILSNAPTIDHVGNKVHPLLDQLLLEYKITEKIVESFKTYEKDLSDGKSTEKGYMGHLTKIANHIAQNVESGVNSELIAKRLKELRPEHFEEWQTFSTDTLAEINKKNTTPLVGGVTLPSSSDDEGTTNFRGLHFSQEAALRTVQQISSNFVDQFNEDFNETEDNLTGQLNRLAQLQNQDLFEQVCQDRTCSINDANGIDKGFWFWEPKEDLDFVNTYGKNNAGKFCRKDSDSSSDSEDEANVPTASVDTAKTEEMKMDVDDQDAFTSRCWGSNLESIPMDTGSSNAQNAWDWTDQPSSTSVAQENWADFSSFEPPNPERSEEISSTTSAVAMETSDSNPIEKFVSSSEVSSTSDNGPELVSISPPPVQIESIQVRLSDEGDSDVKVTQPPPVPPRSPLPPSPGGGETIMFPNDLMEAKVIDVNEVQAPVVESPKEASLSETIEASSNPTTNVQNGPV